MSSFSMRPLQDDELYGAFLPLLAEVESGPDFDFANPRHVQWLQKKIRRRQGAGGQFYGGFLDEMTPVGVMALLLEEGLHWSGYGEVLDMGVFEAFRRKGFGRRLLQKAEELSREAGMEVLYIKTYSADVPAVSLYIRCGFVPVATIPDHNGIGFDGQLVLRKQLKETKL